MFDKNGKGYISQSDLQSILYSAFSMPPDKVEEMFKKIDLKNDGVISYGQFNSDLPIFQSFNNSIQLKIFMFIFISQMK